MTNYFNFLEKIKTVFFCQDTLNSFQFYVTYFEELQQISQSTTDSIKILKVVKRRKHFIGLYMLLFFVFFFIQTLIPPIANIILFNFVFIENLEPYWNICYFAKIVYLAFQEFSVNSCHQMAE